MNRKIVDRDTLIARLRQTLDARPEIVFAVLHGSFEAGRPYRDIDVALWIDSGRVREPDRPRYALELGVALTVTLGVTVDVQVLNDAPLAFRYHALKGMALVVRDEDVFDDLRARTWDDYFDFLPFAREYLREALRA